MPNLASRLRALERRHPPAMLGSLEIHRVGGWPKCAGDHCEEHERCAAQRIPMAGPVRTQIVLGWKEGDSVQLG